MTVVLDAGPMIAYLRGEPGADVVADAMAGPENAIYAHGVNIIEVYYDFLRVSDRATAASAVVTLVGDGVTIREDLDAALRSDVGAEGGARNRPRGLLRPGARTPSRGRAPDDRPPRAGSACPAGRLPDPLHPLSTRPV